MKDKYNQNVVMSINELYKCLKNPELYGYGIEYFWISGVALVCVGCFGLIGNILTTIVLFLPTFRKAAFYRLLIVMAFVDIYFILGLGVQNWNGYIVCVRNYNEATWDLTKYFVTIGRSLSVYTTVVISIERFLKIYYPFLTKRPKTWHYVTFILILSLSYNLPECFERKFFMYNGILYDKLKPYAEDEKYEDNYWLYTDIIVKFVKYFISFVIVVSLNVAIILTTRNSKKNVMIDTNENQRRKSVPNTVKS